MATVNFNAVFKFPTSFPEITAQSWGSISTNTAGTNQLINFFAISQDMTNSLQRSVVIGSIESAITSFYSATVTTSTNSWDIVGGNYEWTINISATATNPETVGSLIIVPTAFFVGSIAGSEYLIFTTTFETDCPDCPPSVNPEDAEDCLSCYQQSVDNCADEIVIQGLEDTATYTVNISDPQSGKTYTSTKISDVNGEITLETSDYPAGLFSPYNSPLTLTLIQDGSPVVLTYGYVNYSCIDLVVTNQTEI